MVRARLNRWLQAPRLTGWVAFFCAMALLAFPTMIRAAVHGTVTGCEFTPFLPFVLISAVLLRWWQAALLSIVFVAVLGGLFLGPSHYPQDLSCFLSAAGLFLASAAMIIGTVIGVRRGLAILLSRGVPEGADAVIFSLEDDQVWASWHGDRPPTPLGSKARVSEMMKDFLAQLEVGERLNRPRR